MFINTRERVPKDFFIQQKDLDDHGYTRGCGGCNSIRRGLTRQPHSPECRKRFEDLLRNTAKVVNAEKRRLEFEERELERKERKREKKEERKKREAETEGGGVGSRSRTGDATAGVAGPASAGVGPSGVEGPPGDGGWT